MKKFLSVCCSILIAGALTSVAPAGEGCSTSAKKVADGASSCSTAKATQVADVTKMSSCSYSGSDMKAEVTKVASADCATKCSDKAAKVSQVAMEDKSSCATSCGSRASQVAQVAMAKGGASEAEGNYGYSVGKKVPDFTLPDTNFNTHSLSDFAGKVVVLVFYNQACPYVVEVEDRLASFTEKYSEKGVQVLAIDAGINNDAVKLANHASEKPYPILVNRDSNLARSFDAKRTPEVFVLDKEGVIQYHGMFDSGKVMNGEGQRDTPAKDAVNALLNGEDVKVKQTKAFGCSIKFNEKTASVDSASDKNVGG